jgi:hypothetical protein
MSTTAEKRDQMPPQPEAVPQGIVPQVETKPVLNDREDARRRGPPCRPLDQLNDPEALAHITVVFNRTYGGYMQGQSAGFVKRRAEQLIDARIARPFDPAVDRQTFDARQIRK